MAENPVWAICERAAEVQTLLDDHIAGGKHTTADVIAKAQAFPFAADHWERPGLQVSTFAIMAAKTLLKL